MTSNSQLDEAMRGVVGFRGTVPVDQIPRKLGEGESVIINLQTSGEGGSHWVCAKALDDGRALYFDSYGGRPDDRVLAMLKRTSPKVVTNTSQYQKKETGTCGHFCVLVLRLLAEEVPLYTVLYKRLTPEPSAKNERVAGGALTMAGGALHRADALPADHIIKRMKAWDGEGGLDAFFEEMGENGTRDIARLPAYDLLQSGEVFLGVGKKSKQLNTIITEAKKRYDVHLQKRRTART
jgi:hypothetical protein